MSAKKLPSWLMVVIPLGVAIISFLAGAWVPALAGIIMAIALGSKGSGQMDINKMVAPAIILALVFLVGTHKGREMAMEYIVTPGWDVMSGGDTVICKMAITKMKGGILENCELPAGYWTFTVEKPVEIYRWTANGLPGPGAGILVKGAVMPDLSQLKYKNKKSYGALLVRSASQGRWSVSGDALIHPDNQKMALEWTINIERPHLKTARTVSALNAVLKFKRHGS